jgi:hypothetical protein
MPQERMYPEEAKRERPVARVREPVRREIHFSF